MNFFSLAGNLGADPELNTYRNDTVVATASIATDKVTRDGVETVWLNVKLFGKSAENFARICQKGSAVTVNGHFDVSKWEDKESGQKRSRVEFIVDRWKIQGGGRQNGSSGDSEETEYDF